MRSVIFIIFCLLLTDFSYADSLACKEQNWPVTHKTSKKGTEMFIYEKQYNGAISASDLACTVGLVFFDRIDSFPKKAVIGIIRRDYEAGYIVKWNVDEDFLLLIELSNTDDNGEGLGYYSKYPQPLKRIKEILINKPFPKKEEVPLLHREKVTTKYFSTNVTRLKMIIGD